MNITSTFQCNCPCANGKQNCDCFCRDYLNKLSGEAVERECKRQINAGWRNSAAKFIQSEFEEK